MIKRLGAMHVRSVRRRKQGFQLADIRRRETVYFA